MVRYVRPVNDDHTRNIERHRGDTYVMIKGAKAVWEGIAQKRYHVSIQVAPGNIRWNSCVLTVAESSMQATAKGKVCWFVFCAAVVKML